MAEWYERPPRELDLGLIQSWGFNVDLGLMTLKLVFTASLLGAQH